MSRRQKFILASAITAAGVIILSWGACKYKDLNGGWD